jgi:siroheme synthase (precorrin-2 oxidase/ferrochelatase)
MRRQNKIQKLTEMFEEKRERNMGLRDKEKQRTKRESEYMKNKQTGNVMKEAKNDWEAKLFISKIGSTT